MANKITNGSTKRGSIRGELDNLLKHCPIEIASYGDDESNRTGSYSFFCHQLSPNQRTRLSGLLTKLTGFDGNFEEYDKLVFRFDQGTGTQNYADFSYFGQEILPHPTFAPRKLNLPEVEHLAHSWRTPNETFEFNVTALEHLYNPNNPGNRYR